MSRLSVKCWWSWNLRAWLGCWKYFGRSEIFLGHFPIFLAARCFSIFDYYRKWLGKGYLCRLWNSKTKFSYKIKNQAAIWVEPNFASKNFGTIVNEPGHCQLLFCSQCRKNGKNCFFRKKIEKLSNNYRLQLQSGNKLIQFRIQIILNTAVYCNTVTVCPYFACIQKFLSPKNNWFLKAPTIIFFFL